MSTATASPTTPRLAFGGVLRSELVKSASLRSIRVVGLALVLLTAAGVTLRAFAFASVTDPAGIGVSGARAWQDLLDTGVQAGELPAVLLAALAVGSEYTARAAQTAFTAVPRRTTVVVAKTVVVLLAVVVAGGIGFALGAAVSLPLMRSVGLGGPSPDLLAGGILRAALLVVYAAFALGITWLTRSTAGGITATLVVLLLLPVATGLLGLVTGGEPGRWLLTYAAPMAAVGIQDPAAADGLGVDLVVTAAWLVVPGAAAVAALARRDV